MNPKRDAIVGMWHERYLSVGGLLSPPPSVMTNSLLFRSDGTGLYRQYSFLPNTRKRQNEFEETFRWEYIPGGSGRGNLSGSWEARFNYVASHRCRFAWVAGLWSFRICPDNSLLSHNDLRGWFGQYERVKE